MTLFCYRPYCFCCVNQVVLMLTSLHLHETSREVCIKARSPPASVAFIGQVTKHTTVKWPIIMLMILIMIMITGSLSSKEVCAVRKRNL